MPERDDPLLTRETLLLRLRDPEDGRSWAEFAEVYTPLLYGYCANRGLAHADAADVVQGVMQSVAKAIRGFDYDPGRGRFKGWLFTIVRRAIAAHASRQARQPATPGETQVMAALDAEPDRSETDRWERDYQRRLLAWAMEKIRPDYSPRVWEAFVETALRGRDPAEVAAALDMTPNAIAVAKYRIVRRLKAAADAVDADQWEAEMIEQELPA